MRIIEWIAAAVVGLALISAGEAWAGQGENKGKDAFGRRVLALLAKHEELKKARYDESCFCIRHDGGSINLHHFYEEMIHHKADEAAVAERIHQTLFGPAIAALEVLPALRERHWVEIQANLRGRLLPKSAVPGGLPQIVVGEHLSLTVVEDYPEKISYLSNATLKERGTDFARLLDKAIANLLKHAPPRIRPLEAGVYAVEGDDYASTHFVLGRLQESLKLKGSPVAVFVSNRLVFVTGDRDVAGLERVAVQAEAAREIPRSWRPRALRFHNGRWEALALDPLHPVHGIYERMRRDALAMDYALQAEVIQEYQQSMSPEDLKVTRDEHAFVASQIVVSGQAGPATKIFATLAHGVDTLLPIADEVAIEDPKGGVPIVVPWDRFIAIMGKDVKETGLWPPRFRVSKALTDRQLARMRAAP